MYTEFAPLWPLVSAPAEYAEEAAFFLPFLGAATDGARPTLLELGSGGGNLASHLKAHFAMTLSDRSPAMLDVSRALNPEVDHILGDMQTLRLGRLFDVVLVHDAIMYATDATAVRATLATAAAHCRRGATVLVAPDCVRETFTPKTSNGGHDAPDGRGLRYLEWTWDPDPSDGQFVALYALVLREADGTARVELDRHMEGVFSRAEWLEWFREAGFRARAVRDPWGRDVFVGTKALGA